MPPVCSGMSQMSTILGSPVVGLNAYSIAQMPFQDLRQTSQPSFPIISPASMPQSTPLMPLPPHLHTSSITSQPMAQPQRSPVNYGHPVNHQTSPHGIIVDEMGPQTPISAGGSPLNSNSPVHLLHPHIDGLDHSPPHHAQSFGAMVSNPSRTHSPNSIYSSPSNSPQQPYMSLNRSPIGL